MDVNIISTAIPHITAEFSSLDDIGWYGSAFLMTTCAFQITWGRIYTMFPVKHMFALALVIFEVGSLLCAVSPNSPVFIVGRSVQGVGVSGMLSGALIIVSLVVPLAQRSLLGGIIGAMEGVAMVAAPLVGGFLTDKVSWRWCFYINLPIGAFVFVVIFFFLHVPPQGTPRNSEVAHMAFTQRAIYTIGQLDLLSMVLLIPTIVLVLLALQWGGTKYPWGSLGIILLFVLAAVLASVFAYVQYCKQDRAMVPPRIVKQRTVLAGFWFMLCTSSALVVMTYFVGYICFTTTTFPDHPTDKMCL
jgi:MFS family permease